MRYPEDFPETVGQLLLLLGLVGVGVLFGMYIYYLI